MTAHSNLTNTQLLDIEDVNGDGKFTNADLQSLLIDLKNGGGSADSVPEPASIVLFGFSATGNCLSAQLLKCDGQISTQTAGPYDCGCYGIVQNDLPRQYRGFFLRSVPLLKLK